MDISGLNALDPRVAATEKFISEKKIPPEQVPQFLMSMGADPRLAGLVMKYQRLKSVGAQGGNAQPPQSTVAQDIDAQSRQGIAAPMAPPPNREQGIANLPAPVMERAQFAGGGIVAFQEGGDPIEVAKKQLLELISEAEQSGDFNKATILRGQLRRMVTGSEQSMAPPEPRDIGAVFRESAEKSRPYLGKPAAATAPATTPVNPAAVAAAMPKGPPTRPGKRPEPFVSLAGDMGDQQGARMPGAGMNLGTANEGIKLLEQQVKDLQKLKPEDREARYRAAGIEDMTPAQLKKIQERIDGLSGDKKRDAYLALAQAGFKMAAAASRPGATFLGALAEGAGEGGKMLGDINKEYRALQSDLEDKVMALQRYQQQRREGQIDRDIEFERETAKDIRGLQKDIANAKTEAERFGVTTQLQREQIEASRERGGRVEEDLKKKIVFAKTQKERDAAMKLLADLRGIDVRILAEQLKAEAAADREAAKNSFGGLGGIGGVSTSAIDEELRRRGAE
jgi:hypothetical protein